MRGALQTLLAGFEAGRQSDSKRRGCHYSGRAAQPRYNHLILKAVAKDLCNV
jgi:hypothetical protein